jgi:hypothetical protein
MDPRQTLKMGYRGFSLQNLSWALSVGSREDPQGLPRLVVLPMMPIEENSFLGILPGNCLFRPDNNEQNNGRFASHVSDLFMDEEGCKGTLSYMQRTQDFEVGNVVGGWAQHGDPTTPNSNAFHILLFAYRDIAAFEPLVFWEHMKEQQT